MIREKVYEILDCIAELNSSKERINQLQKEFAKEADVGDQIMLRITSLKQALGKIILPIAQARKNIVIEREGKYYSVFYDKYSDTARIIECLTDKEADIKFSLDKLTQREE